MPKWLPCSNCGKAWASRTEPLIVGSITSGRPYRYRCNHCRGDAKSQGGTHVITPAAFASLPNVDEATLEKHFPGWMKSHREEALCRLKSPGISVTSGSAAASSPIPAVLAGLTPAEDISHSS